MKRPSWRAPLPGTSGAQSRSSARPRPDDQPGATRPAPILKTTADAADAQDVAPPSTTRPQRADRAPRRPLGRRLRALVAVPVVVAAAALAGCFSITGETIVQDGEIGDVIVTTDMCLTMGASGCAGGLTDETRGDVQYLVGYLVPTWALEPATINWKGDLGNITVARSLPYENILQGFSPAPLGLHWVGYSTNAMTAPPPQTDLRMQATSRIGVPDAAPGTLSLATVTGFRLVRDSAGGTRTALAEDRAYNCAEVTDGLPTTQCILSGQPAQATTPGQTPVTEDVDLNTISLGTPPTVPTIRAGGSAILRFPLSTNYKGDGNDTIPMRVTSTLRGAKFEFPPNVILGGSGLPAEVKVTVPLIANTGDYTVTLATANGIRKATGTIRVIGIRTLISAGQEDDTTVATLKEGVAGLRKYLRTAKSADIRRGNTFDLPVKLPSAGTLTGTLVGRNGGRKKVTLSAGRSTMKIPGTATLHLTPKTAARSMLRSGRSLDGKLRLVFKPRSGKAQSATLTVKLK
ncbi:MAG: hypothetical protein PGN13_14270 [Patulibacter minatonensis]